MDATNTVWFAGEIWSAAMFDRTDAYRLLKEGLIRFPGNCELLVLWGRLAMQEQDPRERESACVALESKKPKNAEICFWSGCLASSLGRTQQALTNWLESARLNPNWAAPYGEIGRAKARMGDSPQVATTWFEKAVELEPNIAVARSDLGYAYYLAGEHANAVRELEKAVVLDPSSGLAWYNLALTHHALGLYKKAFEEAIKAQQCGYKGDASFLRRLEDLQKSLTK